MTQTVQTSEPASLTAGDTAKWQKTFPDYPATDGWVLSYALVKSGNRITFSAGASGADHLINVSAAITAGWTVGRYQWQSSVTLAGERFTVGTGQIEILPNFAAASNGADGRSHARKVLEAIEATLEGRAGQAHMQYRIGERELRFIPIPELLILRDRYRSEVRAEDAVAALARGESMPNKLLTRF